MMAIMFLPRQFQVTVIENLDEKHLNRAIWLFPLYMLAINVFVLPIAFGGLLHFPGGRVDAGTFVLTLPLGEKQEWVGVVGFVGGVCGGACPSGRREGRRLYEGRVGTGAPGGFWRRRLDRHG